jgi:hypothetical protein
LRAEKRGEQDEQRPKIARAVHGRPHGPASS